MNDAKVVIFKLNAGYVRVSKHGVTTYTHKCYAKHFTTSEAIERINELCKRTPGAKFEMFLVQPTRKIN